MLTNLLAALCVIFVVLLIPIIDGFERRIRARIQSRIGPPLKQTYYDLVKLFRKELLIPNTASRLFILAPFISISTSITALAIIPYTLNNSIGFEGDLILIVYLMIFASIATLLGGLASGNPFAEVSSSRELTLVMASELFLGLTIATLAVKYGSLSLVKISTAIVVSPSVILAYMALAYYAFIKSSRTPYDIAEAEPEIASGYAIEFSGPLLAITILSNLMKRFIASSLFTVISLGPLIALLTMPIANDVLRISVNAMLTILLSIATYLVLGSISTTYGRYRVRHAVEAVKKCSIMPLISLMLALLGL